ncbi:MAG: hypothetical protein Q9169_002765 [Polycauliona sp. 2 TL-2023]
MLVQVILSFAAVALAAPSDLARRATYSASFTRYNGCGSSVACGMTGGLTAAVSQNLFGVGSRAGAGPACGTCYAISSGLAGTKSIVVKVTNLCPADQFNEKCSQNGMSGTNSLGTNVHFDLCGDAGAGSAAGSLLGRYAVELDLRSMYFSVLDKS